MNSAANVIKRINNGWYTVGGMSTGVEIIRDFETSPWEVRKNGRTVCIAENFASAKSLARSL